MPDPATRWLVEEGIGEHRAICVEDDRAIAARLAWPGALAAGQVEDAVLVSKAKGATRGTARFMSGEEALVDRLPRNANVGASIRLMITRTAMTERTRVKFAQARATDEQVRPAPSLADHLRASGREVQIVRKFPGGLWEDVMAEAWAGSHQFDGGSLHFSPTPAMTLIDVDGILPPRDLALAAVRPIAVAAERFGLNGSVGIDFPTLPAKADRKAVDDALAHAFAHVNCERTAMNGFGFVQIISRVELPSLLHRIEGDRASSAARFLLRQAETIAAPGAILLTAHPVVLARLEADWLSELARRSGRTIRQKADPGLALEGAFAQSVPL